MKNCNCDCHEIPADRKYILMKPLNLKHRTLPVGTIITGPINPIWFEDNIVKVYKGNVKPLSLEDIIQTSVDYDIRIENDKDIIFSINAIIIKSVIAVTKNAVAKLKILTTRMQLYTM